VSTVEVEQALGMEPATRGAALLALREDQWFDRKSARILPRALADAAVGMANAEGGTIVVGLSKGVVEGIDRHRNQLNGWQQSTMDFTVPRVPAASRLVDCVDARGELDRLFVLDIDASEMVHANQRDDVFLRVGDENRKLSFDQRRELMFDKGQATYETTVVPDATPEELDSGLLDSYALAVRHGEPLRLLQARGLVTRRNGALTVGALVLFGVEPQARYPEAIVRVLRYRGTERGTGSRQQLLNDLRCDGPIPLLLSNAREAISEWVPSRRALGSDGRFEQIGIVPRDAWMEALVNAVVHRSYSMMGDHIRVEIFDDRIEVESPGRFPGLVDPTDPLAVTRFARNPRIARVCADLRFGEELGEGIRRMFEEMRLAGLADPIYHQTSGSVRVTLLSTPVDRRLEARLPRGARDLARYVREAGRISTGELVQASGLSRPVVIRRLKALEEAGVVQWVGNTTRDPRAYWKLRIH
jgi:ATP-dependent DNA helicase RecG